MTPPKIKSAPRVALGLIVAAVIGFAVVAVQGMGDLNQSTQDISSEWLPKVILSKDMSIDLAIQNITASMNRLADGDTASTVPYEGRADEIGQMAAAVTQQNAAMVEETNAAGASLASESGRLRQLIAQFQLGSTLRHTASAMAAGPTHRPVASPVQRLAGQVAQAFSAQAIGKDGWEEF